MSRAALLFDDAEYGKSLAAERVSLRLGIAIVLGIFLATRLVVWTFAYAGAMINFRIRLGLEPPFEKHLRELRDKYTDTTTDEGKGYQNILTDLAPLTNADGRHYAKILKQGYQYQPVSRDAHPAKRQQNIAFFPLYPLVCYPLTYLFGVHGAMILVVHLAALAGGFALYFWVRQRVDEHAARFSVACLFCLPTACYFSFGYAESLTLLLTVVTLMLADRRAFLVAAVVCGLATATRPTALGLVPVFMLAYWFNAGGTRAQRLGRLAPLTIVASSGILLYAGYLTYRFGSPLVYLDNFRVGWIPDSTRSDWFQYVTLARVWDQFKYFGRVIKDFPIGLVNLVNPFAWNMPVNFAILFLSLAGLAFVPRSFRPLLLLGPFIFMHSYTASGGATFGVEPIARYTAVSVPAFIVLAAWCTRELCPAPRYVLLTVMMLIQAAWSFHFGMDEWSG